MLRESIAFDPQQAEALLRKVPQRAGVFALYGHQDEAQPYVTRTANLRRRLLRLLAPPESQSKRLNLRDRVARIEYALTGSEFEATLLLYQVSVEVFGVAETRRRMRLHTPYFLRMAWENAYPRVYVTNRLAKRALAYCYGPFPSRAAAERFLDESLNLFKLRRCHEELNPDPSFPGCVYSEMKMCLAPCFKGCTDERYAEESAAVRGYLETHGASLITKITSARDKASEELEFEQAAALHGQMQRAKATSQLADEIVRPLTQLNALMLQPAAEADMVALFLVRDGILSGPEMFSTLGMRHPNEQSGSSSLFAHPVALAPVPLEGGAENMSQHDTLENRLARAIASLESNPVEMTLLADHLALLKRWYYRPEKQRAGEIFFREDGFPVKRILRGISRVYAGSQKLADPNAAPAADGPQA
ncbi:MAG: excinuclease ABC subunit C [Acidobacteriaceae bacterium]